MAFEDHTIVYWGGSTPLECMADMGDFCSTLKAEGASPFMANTPVGPDNYICGLNVWGVERDPLEKAAARTGGTLVSTPEEVAALRALIAQAETDAEGTSVSKADAETCGAEESDE